MADLIDLDPQADFAEDEDIAAPPRQVPELAIDGFEGPLDLLLSLSRAHRINLAVLSIGDIMDQLASALREAPPAMPLSQKADWVVMAAWLLLLRSNLLLPADEPEQIQAEADAAVLRDRLLALQHMQALAGWLERRDMLGRDVFARGDPEWSGELIQHHRQIDRVAFVWACMELFDERDYALTEGSMYRPAYLDLFEIPEARNRIVRYFSETNSQGDLFELLPAVVKAETSKALSVLRRRSAWTSTFVAMLELAKQGVVELEQHEFLGPIKVQRSVTT
jgi:segregation and condensation protein A